MYPCTEVVAHVGRVQSNASNLCSMCMERKLGGKPLSITAGTSDLKFNRKAALNPLTDKAVIELQHEFSGTNFSVQKVVQWVRHYLGRKALAPHAVKKAQEKGKELLSFYAVET